MRTIRRCLTCRFSYDWKNAYLWSKAATGKWCACKRRPGRRKVSDEVCGDYEEKCNP